MNKNNDRCCENKNNISCEKKTRKRKIRQSIAETAPKCNDCVATIAAKPFTLTVKGGNQPSEEEIRVLFPRIQESGGVLRPELKLFQTNF